MKIYTEAGELSFKTFSFPDGQPHLSIDHHTFEFEEVTIETAIDSMDALFNVEMAIDVLRNLGYQKINLNIRYLLGARMDRTISNNQPFTLQLIARRLNALGLNMVKILDAHSEVSTKLIAHSVNVLPKQILTNVLRAHPNVIVVSPDKGGQDRILAYNGGHALIEGRKVRDPHTGKLSGFSFETKASRLRYEPHDYIIVDDICDGGGTFVGLGNVLREQLKVRKLYLFITHGLFTQGFKELREVFDRIYMTNSVSGQHDWDSDFVTILPVDMRFLKG